MLELTVFQTPLAEKKKLFLSCTELTKSNVMLEKVYILLSLNDLGEVTKGLSFRMEFM